MSMEERGHIKKLRNQNTSDFSIVTQGKKWTAVFKILDQNYF